MCNKTFVTFSFVVLFNQGQYLVIAFSLPIAWWLLKKSTYPLVARRVFCDVSGGNRIHASEYAVTGVLAVGGSLKKIINSTFFLTELIGRPPQSIQVITDLMLQVERVDMIGAYYRRLLGDDEAVKLECARRWSQWEMATSRLIFDPALLRRTESDVWALQFARIEWCVRASALLVIIAEMTVFNVAGYLVEERRGWPVIYRFPTRTIFQVNSEF